MLVRADNNSTSIIGWLAVCPTCKTQRYLALDINNRNYSKFHDAYCNVCNKLYTVDGIGLTEASKIEIPYELFQYQGQMTVTRLGKYPSLDDPWE